MVWVVYRPYRELREEIAHLPRAGHSTGLPHIMLGSSLRAAIPLPDHLKGVAAVVQFASPSCPLCREEMRVLEQAYQDQPFPYLCLYETDSEENEKQFVADFGHMHLQPIEPELARSMGVAVTPLVVLIDEDAIVRRVEYRLTKILGVMRAAKRRAG